MLKLFRKWGIELKRRRLKKERELLKRYVDIEDGVKGEGNRCHNCGAPLTGPFCHICGQKDDDLRRPIWTFFRELFDAIFDTDSKIIKTILLLVLLPGGLSRAFMEGKRARFLPPFRLYVVLLFVFFSTLSLADILILDIQVQPKAERVAARVAEAQERARIAAEEAQRLLEEEQQKQKIMEEVRESTAELEEELVRDGLMRPGDITKNLDLETPEARPLPPKPLNVPDLPGLQQALEDAESDQAEAGQVIGSLIGRLVREAATGAEEATNLEEGQDRIRDLLDNPNNQLSDKQREMLEGFLELDLEEIEEEIADAREQAAEDNADRTAGDGFNFGFDKIPYNFDLSMFVENSDEDREGIKQEDIDYVLNDPTVPQIFKDATQNLAEALRSPREFNELFNDYLPWALVILMPVFAFILRATHWGKRRYYLNQLVFALHFHSFLFVLFTVFAFVIPVVGGEGAFDIFWWGTSAYLIIALKVGQDQGWIRAFFKAGFIWVSYFAIMMATMLGVMFVGLSKTPIRQLWDMFWSAV